MNKSSRLDAARESQAANKASGQEWFRSPLVLVAGLILFLAALGLIVLSLTGDDDTVTAADTTGDTGAADTPPPSIGFGGVDIPEVDAVMLDGEPLPALEPGEDDAAVGMLAPQITATSLGNGSAITLSPGKARVIGFFAHWCPHCQAELPELTDWLADNKLPPNTEFIAVSTAVDPGSGNYPPSDWFTEVGFTSPVIVDDADGTLLNGFGFGGFPAFVAIDASGVVVARAGGNIGTDGFEALLSNFAS